MVSDMPSPTAGHWLVDAHPAWARLHLCGKDHAGGSVATRDEYMAQ